MARLDVNAHLVVVGNFGRHQWVCLLLAGSLAGFIAMQMFVSIYTQSQPDHRCEDQYMSGNLTVAASNKSFDNLCSFQKPTVDGFNISVKCERFTYDSSQFTSTLVTEFDMVCDNMYLSTIVSTAWMISGAIGAVLGSYLCDRFGRKPITIATYFAIGVIGSAAASSVDVVMYTLLICSMALISFAGFTAIISLAMESTSPAKRSHAVNGLGLLWVCGGCLLPLLGYFLRDWRHLLLAISLPNIPFGIACIWLIDESPHWLMINGKKKKAYDVLKKMARWNRVSTPYLDQEMSKLLEKDLKTDVQDTVSNTSEGCCQLWGYRRVLVRFIIFSFGWLTCSFGYYALSFGVPDLPGNLYLNGFIMSAMEGVAYALCFCVAWWGRKLPGVASYILGGISLLISVFLMIYSPGSTAITVLSFIGKLFISAAWQILGIWQAELYPTTQRCLLIGLNAVVGRIGSVLVPYMVDLHKYIDLAHDIVILPSIFVVLMISAGLLHLILPETNNRNLPATLAEANAASFPIVKENENIQDGMEDENLVNETKIDA